MRQRVERGCERRRRLTLTGFTAISAGNVLQNGDTVTVIKDLKPKGFTKAIKVGTRVKNIRLVDSDHDIDCKIEGFGAMSLKSEFVKKV